MRNPIELANGAFAILRDNMKLFLGILLVPVIVAFVSALFAPTPAEQMIGLGFSSVYIIMMLLSGIVNVFMGIAIILVMENRSLTAMESYRQAAPFFLRYIGMSIIMSIALFIGFLLLIIPGIILSVWFAFSTFVLVLERGGMIESLKKSREYVRGRWWGVFGRLVVMGIILILISLVLSMLSYVIPSIVVSNAVITALAMVLAPFSVAYMYLLYQDLRGARAPVAAVTSAPQTV